MANSAQSNDALATARTTSLALEIVAVLPRNRASVLQIVQFSLGRQKAFDWMAREISQVRRV
jgi:hypothetical protein